MPLNLALKTQSQTDFFEFEAMIVYIVSAGLPEIQVFKIHIP